MVKDQAVDQERERKMGDEVKISNCRRGERQDDPENQKS